MKLDYRGIIFRIWLYIFTFAIGIVVLLGSLQFFLIRPYYRNTKITVVKNIVSILQDSLIENGSVAAIKHSFSTIVENNVCVNIYNDQNNIVYQADGLGTSCVFGQVFKDYNFADVKVLKDKLMESIENEYRVSFTNPSTSQEMILYGKKITSKLGNYYIFVNSPLEPIDSIITFFSRSYLFYTFIVILIASMIALSLAMSITKPIITINSSAKKLAHADYQTHFEGGSFTETRQLAETLNDATKKLSKIDELRKDLIANISHDIKTPLTSIRAYAEMVKDFSYKDEKKRNEHLNVIIEESLYLNHLVSDMQELSKMQSGNYELQYKHFDLNEKIEYILTLYQVQIEESEVLIEKQFTGKMMVFADEIKISQVISNYLSNAIKHTPKNKTIHIKTLLKSKNIVRFEMKDDGEGIAEQDLPYIWDRYQKSSRSFSRSMTNTGLGLAIVKAILDSHHAEYGVESKIDQGTLFWFELNNSLEKHERG